MSHHKCPICGKLAAPRADNQYFPFCSGRCKDIDLGDWLGEKYKIASPSLDFHFPLPTDPDDEDR